MIKQIEKKLGNISVKDCLYVTDPCYSDPECVIKNVQPGIWNAKTYMQKEGVWGTRVAKLTLHYISPETLDLSQFKKHKVGKTCVDSGQAGFFTSLEGFDEGRYDKICEMTLSDDQAGILEDSCISSTGFGDGMYSIYCCYHQEKVIYAEIVYISDRLDNEHISDKLTSFKNSLIDLREEGLCLLESLGEEINLKNMMDDATDQLTNIIEEFEFYISEFDENL